MMSTTAAVASATGHTATSFGIGFAAAEASATGPTATSWSCGIPAESNKAEASATEPTATSWGFGISVESNKIAICSMPPASIPAVADERSRQAAEEAQAAYDAAEEEVKALQQQLAELEQKSSAGAGTEPRAFPVVLRATPTQRMWLRACVLSCDQPGLISGS